MEENLRFIQLLDILKSNGVISDYVQIAQQLGTNKAAISDIKGCRKKLSIDLLRRLKLSYPSVDLVWIIMGTGSPFCNTNNYSTDGLSLDILEKISKQAEEIGCLKERIRQLCIKKDNCASDASSSEGANVG